MQRVLIILLLLTSVAFAQSPKDIRLLSEDNRSLTLEFVPKLTEQTLRSADGGQLSRIAFSGEIIDRHTPGAPWISYRGIPLQFPTSRASVTVVSVESHTVEGARPMAVPKMIPDPKFGFSPVFQSAITGSIPAYPLAAIFDVTPSGGKYLGTLRLYPVRFDQSSGSATVCTKMIVRITFDAWSDQSMKTSTPAAGVARPSGFAVVPRSTKRVATDSPLAQGTWYKMDVRQTGIFRIDQAFLQQAGISASSIGNINSIRIFGNGGRMLPEDLLQSRPNGLVEVARYVVDNNANGQFDADDYVLFYGRSTRGWDYDPLTKTYSHYFSYYSEPDYYFLTFGGTTGIAMDTVVSANVAGAFTPSDFQEKIFLKQDRYNLFGSGRQWVGQQFDYISNSAVYSNALPGYVAGSTVQYGFVFLSRSSTVDTFTVYESGQRLGPPIPMSTVDVSPSQNETYYAYFAPRVTYTASGLIANNRSNVKIAFGTSNQAAKGWIDYMDLFYRRTFDAVGGALLFDSPDTSAMVQYVVHSLPTSTVYVFDVTDQNAVKRITQVSTDVADGTVRTFRASQTAGALRRFAVVGLSGTLTPSGVTRISNTNIHGQSPGADFVIITPGAFADEAERLRVHRQAHDSLRSLVVTIDNVYNEFSGGLLDPMAIRDFLRYAESNWTVVPKYVLLFGGGHYDYKNILSSTPNYIPPYESSESNYQIDSFASDDFFVMLDVGNPRTSIAIGRIPARSLAEATSTVDKIIEYETNAPFDTWRNRITFVADDGLTSGGDDGNIHTAQAEDLANNHTPDSFEKRKIYLSEYSTVLSATGRTKPQVNKDIVSAFNRGTLIVNFSGHGNSQLWAHEAVFTQAADLPQLTNFSMLSFLVAATCNYAQYDNPTEQSAGEEILVMDKGGVVIEVTSSRAVYQYSNQEFNNQLYDYLWQRDAQGSPRRLGDAMWLTKQVLYGTNDIKYHLLGDPTMRLDVPRATVSLDSVNGISTTQLVAMKSLGVEKLSGFVRKPDGTPWQSFNGKGIVEVFDSQRQLILQDINNYPVEIIGSVLYRGEVSVTNGAYSVTFPIPKDVTYGSRSRLSLYAWNNVTDGVGYTESVTINGTDSTAAADTSGPVVRIYFDDQSFRAGDRVQPNTTLIVDLQSRNGINTSSVGIGHRLEAVLNKTSAIDLTDFYRGDLDTYQSGEVRYPMTNLAAGNYSIQVKAWDIRNNSSTAESYFTVSSTSGLELANVMNYPNPFSRSTTFTFQRNSADPIDVEVRIYTIAGRLIQTLDAFSITDRFVRVPWDGRDRDGDPIANGVYLYKVTARTIDRQSTKEELGKLVMMK